MFMTPDNILAPAHYSLYQMIPQDRFVPGTQAAPRNIPGTMSGSLAKEVLHKPIVTKEPYMNKQSNPSYIISITVD